MPSHQYTGPQLFNQMREIVEAPGYKYLTHYKSDLYEHDKRTMLEEFSHGMEFLWAVKPCGTTLVRYGVHDKQTEWATASIESAQLDSSLGFETYIVSSAGVRKVTCEEALKLVAAKSYLVTANAVKRATGEILAAFTVRRNMIPGDGNNYMCAVFQAANLQELSLADLFALRDIATSEAVLLARSFFVKVESISINGIAFEELIQQQHTQGQPAFELVA